MALFYLLIFVIRFLEHKMARVCVAALALAAAAFAARPAKPSVYKTDAKRVEGGASEKQRTRKK